MAKPQKPTGLSFIDAKMSLEWDATPNVSYQVWVETDTGKQLYWSRTPVSARTAVKQGDRMTVSLFELNRYPNGGRLTHGQFDGKVVACDGADESEPITVSFNLGQGQIVLLETDNMRKQVKILPGLVKRLEELEKSLKGAASAEELKKLQTAVTATSNELAAVKKSVESTATKADLKSLEDRITQAFEKAEKVIGELKKSPPPQPTPPPQPPPPQPIPTPTPTPPPAPKVQDKRAVVAGIVTVIALIALIVFAIWMYADRHASANSSPAPDQTSREAIARAMDDANHAKMESDALRTQLSREHWARVRAETNATRSVTVGDNSIAVIANGDSSFAGIMAPIPVLVVTNRSKTGTKTNQAPTITATNQPQASAADQPSASLTYDWQKQAPAGGLVTETIEYAPVYAPPTQTFVYESAPSYSYAPYGYGYAPTYAAYGYGRSYPSTFVDVNWGIGNRYGYNVGHGGHYGYGNRYSGHSRPSGRHGGGHYGYGR